MIYKLIRPFLFLLPAESAHTLIHWFGALGSKIPFVWKSTAALLRGTYPELEQKIAGVVFPNPVGLAAGFDKPGELIDILYATDFGFIEVGTVTPRAQDGNPKPRLFRVPKDRAIINRMGFNNDGIDVFVKNIKRRKSSGIVGANIGKNKDTDLERATEDYQRCAEKVLPYADYITINVSSPNTPGLRALQERGPLQDIILTVQLTRSEQPRHIPIFLKIAPDLTDEALQDVADVLNSTHCDGVIATNTTIERTGLTTPDTEVASMGAGGLSGQPLRDRSTDVIRTLYRATGGKIPIIGVGGIFSAEDAYAKIRAGASLVQVYTGLIYEGPLLARRMNRRLCALLRRDGFSHIAQAVGIDSK